MIRINLIQPPAREREAKVGEAPALLQNKGLLPLASLVVCFGVVGLLYWNSNREIANLNRHVAAEQQEARRLTAIEAQNRSLQAQLAAIDLHKTLIQNLQNSRTGPEQLMTLLGDAAGRVNGLYLLSVDTKKGRLTIHGQSDYMNAIADFISVLQQIPSFEDVELRQVFEDDLKRGVSFQFDLDCAYRPAGQTSGAPSAAGAGAQPGLQARR